ncbi:MAG: hypothetical protein IRY95_06160, partial [Clostridia bacterium]|nr:hypothetical protein [Clostridia bacterium]
GELVAGPASEVLASAAAPLQAAARRRAPLGLVPRLQVVRDGRLLDLSALSEPSQVLAALAAELQQASPDEVVLLLIDWPRWL